MELLNKATSMDGSIIIGFLLFNLFIGIYFSRGITNIKEYALGGRNFGTATVAYTIIATWLSGDSFTITSYGTYSKGLYFMIPELADGIAFLIIAYSYAPRMQEFLGKLSIAEAMGDMYGNIVRVITALAGIFLAIGITSLQFATLITILSEFMGISEIYAVILSCMIVIIYSTLGGIRAVTFTDIVQFFTFGVVVPLTAFFIWRSYSDNDAILSTINNNPLLDFKNLFNYNNPKFVDTLLLFLFYLIPCIDPTLFQRISMTRNIKQATKSFLIAGIMLIICKCVIIDFIGILLLSDPAIDLGPDNVAPYILNHYLDVGFKGVFVIGIMALSMSTADSYMNAGAVLLAYDLREAAGIKISKDREMFSIRLIAFLIGITSLILSIFSQNLFDLLLNFYSFYMPIISIPFMLAIFGFRSTSVPVLLGMSAGFLTVLFLKIFIEMDNTVVIGMFANLITYMGSHYLLRQPGGWVGVKDNGTFSEIQRSRSEARHNFFSAIQNFSIVTYLINSAKKQESNYVYLGFYCVISIFFNLYSMPKEVLDSNRTMINFIAYTTLFLSTIQISYPAWLTKFKNPLFISSAGHSAIFTALVSSIILMPLNNFGQLQITVLTATFFVTAILLRWHTALLFIITGIPVGVYFYKYSAETEINFESITTEFSIAYIMIVTTLICLAFLKPKEDTLALLETKSSNLWQKVNDMDKEVRSANNIKTEFISNINHEVRTPMTGITSLSQALWDNYDHVPESKRRECVYTIAKNSERLISLMNNILDYSNLTSLKMSLHLKKTNITELVHDSLKRCKKLYLEDKDLRFNMDIGENIYANCDGHYISHTIDNLIINAISYSKRDTTVRIILEQHEGRTYFAVRDEGIGIPKEELATIFKPFTTGTKTQSPAGGRGVGLALCYAAITAHKGRIWAESDSSSWAKFSFEI